MHYGPKIVRDGLVLCLDAANPKSYPGSGTTWYDLSGNGNHGTLYNNATFNSTNSGNIIFDGVDDYIDLNTTNIINGTNAFTIECFFTLSSGNYGELFGNYGSGYTTNYVWFSTAGLYLNGPCYVPNYATATQGTHYVASSKNVSGDCITYLDGVQVATATLNYSIASGPNFRIGADTSSSGSPLGEELNGKIYQLKVYNRALSAAEISQNFNAIRRRFSI